ncbi:MAG: hypothetical protein FGM15_11910 [Chthoniobacterales bacterium]|nr:hypothetical protein [Chthoniobacterales bacterium]
MHIPLKILAATVTSRVLRSGEEKGSIKYSVDLYAHTGDNIPSKFVISGLSSESEAQAIASKYPHNANVVVNLVPRDALWLDAADISPASSK